LPTVVLLELDSGLLPVQVPKDDCGKTRPEVIEAYQALRWREVDRVRLERLRSEAAVASGCDGWQDELAIHAWPLAPPGGPGALPAPTGEVRVCRYRSSYPTDANQVAQGVPAGGFVASPSQAAQLVAAIGAAGPAAACEQRHSGFAVVHLGDTGLAYVELDGCRRILAPDHTLRQGDAGLVALLTTG
jgi:hypothetical protein